MIGVTTLLLTFVNHSSRTSISRPLLNAKESEYTLEELQQRLEKNPTRALDVKPMMQIAFEKLDKSLQHALIVSLSLFPKSFRRDAAFATGDDCTKTLTDLKERCLIQEQDDRNPIHLLIRDNAKEIVKRDEYRQFDLNASMVFSRTFCHWF